MDIGKTLNIRENAKKAYNTTYTTGESLTNFLKIVIKLGIIFIILTLNFLGLSVALNCNANSTFTVKLGAAIFGFFFGFIYLVLNYYTYRVLTLRKVCRMNPDRLFPLNA